MSFVGISSGAKGMAEGYVYILVNQYVPQLVKIGYTDRDPSTRAAELSNTTGVPGKWKLYTSWLLEDAYSCEQKIFFSLASYRETGEFFRLSPDTSVEKVSALLASWGAVDIDGLSAPARLEAKRIQLIEIARNAARNAAQRAAQRAAHEETLRLELLKKWDEKKGEAWEQASRQAESRYGEVLGSINNLNIFDLFFSSQKTKDADRRRNELFAIRNKLFRDIRRIFFESKNIRNPFDDSEPV